MEPMELQEIAKAIGAPYTGGGMVSCVSTDTRSLTEGSLFLALSGENFDGHDYVGKALECGAAYAVVMQRREEYPADRILLVEDTRRALLRIAGLYRRQMGVKVVGITGSVGKTTTKEMTACALSARYSTLKNEANLNNEVGLSQTILGLESSHQAAVLEMGMDGPGQIRPLSLCAAPDVAIVTNVGVSHLENLGSRENIRKEKLSIADGMPDGATLILPADNDMLQDVACSRLEIMRFGIDSHQCDVSADRIKAFSTHTTFEIQYNNKRFDAQLPCMGRHNVYNALAAFCAGVALGIEPQEAIAALRRYVPAGMRQNIVQHNSYTVVEDCYNASPESMRAALETLGALECEGRRIAVLSDMLELGSVERQGHYDTGALAAKSADILLCTGQLAREYQRGAVDAGLAEARHFPGQDDLFEHLKTLLRPGDLVWFKASRGMKLEQVIHRIYKEC